LRRHGEDEQSAKGAKCKAWGNAPGWSPLSTQALKARNKSRKEPPMSQSLSSILIHLVFSTRHREPFITPAIETELHPYMATVFRELKSPSLTIGGTSDHVHILFSLSRVIAVADLVEEVKTSTSKWIKTNGLEFRNFHWQKGYGAFSIGQSNVDSLKRYIRSQKHHHQRVTFQDEYRKFLEAYKIDYDEKYVWE
jgi:putative transposase